MIFKANHKFIYGLIFFLLFQGFTFPGRGNGSSQPWKKDYKEAVKLFNQEKYAESLKIAAAALNSIKTLKGAEDPATLKLTNLVGILQAHLGTDAIAESTFVEVIGGLEKKKQTASKLYGITLENLGLMYLLQNYPDSAEDYYKRALQTFTKVLGPGHVRVAVTLNSLGLLYLRQKKYEAAEKQLLDSKQIFEAAPQYLPRERAVMFHNLGELYFALKDYEKAGRNAKRALKFQTQTEGKGARRRKATLDLLKRIYEQTDRPVEAADMRAKIENLKEQLPPKASEYVTDLLIWKIDKI